jgi:hypothetical protein
MALGVIAGLPFASWRFRNQPDICAACMVIGEHLSSIPKPAAEEYQMSELGEGRIAALEFSRAFQGPDRFVQ